MVSGMLHQGLAGTPGLKGGDVEKSGTAAEFHTISDKARAVAGGVLEAIMRKYGGSLT